MHPRLFSKYDWTLLALFVVTLPVVRPCLHGDGYGYYAFARSIIFQRDLNFEPDFLKANEGNPNLLDPDFRANYVSSTGYFANHFTLGPALLWSPFLFAARIGAVLRDKYSGSHLAQNGFSKPYMVAMGLGTAVYGFLGLWLSFRLGRKYFADRWAFFATIGIWLASSLAFYIYVDPSFSHAHSAFAVALFVWYWESTRGSRNWLQWLLLGIIAGLMVSIYYPNALLMLLPAVDSAEGYWRSLHDSGTARMGMLLAKNLVFAATVFLFFIPSFITKKILYGSYFNLGYKEHWFWYSPAFLKVWFSTDHGLFTWTPILIPAVLGLILLCKMDRKLGASLLFVFLAFTYFIGCYETWHGLHSFGARYFVSLTILFVLGLAASLRFLARRWQRRSVVVPAAAAVFFLAIWNFGLIFQFGTHLIPPIGPISFRDAAYNQVMVVPIRATRMLQLFLAGRARLAGRDESARAEKIAASDSSGTK